MTVSRTFDAATVNAVVNDPDVRPALGGKGDLDLSQAIANDDNLFLMGEHGGFALILSEPGSYEVHTFIKKSGRGPWAREAAAAGIAEAKRRGATALWSHVPLGALNVAAYAEGMGMRDTGLTERLFDKPYAVYRMEV